MDRDKKIELECDYCGVPISEDDHRCPNCGASCIDKIKKYRNQQEQMREEEVKQNTISSQQLSSDMGKAVKAPIAVIAIGVLIVMVVPLTIGLIVRSSRAEKQNNTQLTDTKEYNTSVGFDEVGETEEYSIQLDSYELYSYVSDSFPALYNTPKGYQKIAFHFVYENKQDTKQYISELMIQLKADGYKVDDASLKIGPSERVEVGKENYPSIIDVYVDPKETIQGYMGYLIPIHTKELKFSFRDIKITMDNPVYEPAEEVEE